MQEENNVNLPEEESTESDEITLSTFTYDDEAEQVKKPKKAGMTKKHVIALIAIAAAIVVLTLVYFLVLRPYFEEKKAEEPEELVPLLEGEVRDSDGVSVLMFPLIDRANVKQIRVDNPSGGYTLVHDGEDSTDFIIKEHPASPIKAETVSQLVVSAGYPIVTRRLEDSCTDFAKYGLVEGEYYAKCTVDAKDGAKYTFYVGDLIPSGGGYYCKYEGRDAVYIISSDMGKMLGYSSSTVLSPVLGMPLGSEEATMIDYLGIDKNGDEFVGIKYLAPAADEVVISAYEMTYPANHTVDDDRLSNELLTTLSALEGTMVVAAGDGTAEGRLIRNEKLMAQFGFYDLDNPAYQLYYSYGEQASMIIFTESGTEGYYFAYSYIWDTIVFVAKTSVPYLEWSLLDYTSNKVFRESISNIKSITVKGALEIGESVHNVDEQFLFWYEDKDLCCKAESTDMYYKGNNTSINYVQAFYWTMLTIERYGYASEVGFDMAYATEYASIEVVWNGDAGKTVVYTFYKNDDNVIFYEINGEGQFYTTREKINKVMVDAVRAANNCYVDFEADYGSLPDIYLEKK